jgi:PAS domain S-box-containing protein
VRSEQETKIVSDGARTAAVDGLLEPQQLERILLEVADGITVQSADGRLVFANDAAAALIGYPSAAELLATPVRELMARFELLDEHRAPLPVERLPGRLALSGVEGAEEIVCYRIRATGEERWSIVRASPIHAADGTVAFAVNVFHDVTERKRSELRLRFLAEATRLLNSTLRYEETLAELGRLLVPDLADYCLVDMLEPDGSMRTVVLAHVDPGREPVLEELRRRYPLVGNEAHPAIRALATGAPVLLTDVDEAALREAALDDEHLELYRRLEPSSYLVVPLVARGRTLGTISLGMGVSGRHFGAADVELAVELADRAAVAVDNARLYELSQVAARQMEESHALLDNLFASTPVGLGVWDRDLRYVRVNDALARINGLPADEHIGRTLGEIVPGIAAEFEPIYRRVLETGEPHTQHEASASSPSSPGVERHWLTSYYPVKTQAGEVVGIGAVIMDITDRRRVEQALRESEERFRTLADSAPVLIWMTGVDQGCTYVNRTWLDFTGRELEDELGRGWLDCIHPDDRERSWQTYSAAFESREPFTTEARQRRHDGEYRWVLAEGVPRFTPEGAFIGYIGSSLDFTERRLAEGRLRFLAEASRVLASSLDVEATFARLAELSVPEIADWCALDLVDPDGSLRRVAIAHEDPKRVEVAWQLHRRYPPRPGDPGGAARAVTTGESQLVREITDEYLEQRVGDAGPIRLVRELGLRSFINVPLRARGRPVGALTFVNGESRRRFGDDDLALAEELARRAATAVDNARLFHESEERARAAQALAFVGDGVFLVDRNGVVRIWNPAAERITGLSERRVVGRPAAEAIPGWDELVSRVPIASGSGGLRARAETLPLELGGGERWLSISGVGFEEGTVFAFRDLTDERGVERMKSDFVSTVSHELRTPLAAIYGAALTLRREDMPLEAKQRTDLLGVIANEADRLARIVNDILWASRLEADSVPFTIGVLDAGEIAARVVQSTRLHLPPDVDVDLVAADSLPPLAADPDKLSQVLANLLENAVKYSPDGGRVELRLEQRNSSIRFVVTDEGLGIPASERERVFEKFYRLDPNLTHGVGGTGLGLYICRELVARMEGQIWVEPRAGRGTTVVVELPAA